MCPYYIAIGMSYEQYWYDDPYLVRVYKRAYDIKKQEQNQILWLQGLYNYNAFATALGNLSSAIAGRKGTAEYIKEPLDIFPKTKSDKEIQAIKERNKIIDYFTEMKKSWDLTHQNGE